MAETKPEKLSFSKIDTYDQCPYRFHLRYDLKNFVPVDNAATAFGSLVHKVFEIQTNWIVGGKPIDYDFLKKYFVEADGAGGTPCGTDILSRKYRSEWFTVDKTGRSYAQKAQRFLEDGIYRLERYMKENPDLELYAAELPFEYMYSHNNKKYLFHGFIDRVFVHKSDRSHLEIHDIKTSPKAYADKKCVTPLQMVVYVQALKEILPKDEFGKNLKIDCYYEFPIAEEMKRGGTPGFINRGLKKIDSLIDGFSSGDYEPSPSQLCYWCEFSNTNPSVTEDGKNKCPYYSLYTPSNQTYNTFLPWLGMECDEIQHKKLLAIKSLDDEEDFEI